MGVRLKEEIRQCLAINALPKEMKQERIEEHNTKLSENTNKNFKVYVIKILDC